MQDAEKELYLKSKSKFALDLEKDEIAEELRQ